MGAATVRKGAVRKIGCPLAEVNPYERPFGQLGACTLRYTLADDTELHRAHECEPRLDFSVSWRPRHRLRRLFSHLSDLQF